MNDPAVFVIADKRFEQRLPAFGNGNIAAGKKRLCEAFYIRGVVVFFHGLLEIGLIGQEVRRLIG